MRRDTVDSKPEYPEWDYFRKFYRDDVSETFVDSMKRVSEAAIYNQMTYAQSEFKKPYLTDGDYTDMENGYSPPLPSFIDGFVYPTFPTPVPHVSRRWVRWRTLPIDEPYVPPTESGTEIAEEQCNYCMITCYPGHCHEDGSVDPIECHYDVACFLYETGSYDYSWRIAGISPVKPTKITDFSMAPGWTAGYVKITGPTAGVKLPKNGLVNVLVEFTDGVGNTCTAGTSWYCKPDCDCNLGANPYTWPSINPTTISGNSTRVVTVSGGCYPYTWELIEEAATEEHSASSYNYSLGATVTNDELNTIIAANILCGNTPDRLSPKVKVKVTDDCGHTVSGTLLSTLGGWRWYVPQAYLDHGHVGVPWTQLARMTLHVDFENCYVAGLCPGIQDNDPVDGNYTGTWVIKDDKLWFFIDTLQYYIHFINAPQWETNVYNDHSISVEPPPCGVPLNCYYAFLPGDSCGHGYGINECYPYYYGLAIWTC